ncbi:MAG: class I SAM-dependent methyltransferase [Chloroflexota bacterium]|nr:class I SAM-dependent methyltransferase [Chloroflexota bacterium]
MSTKTIQITDELHEYMLAVSLREPAILRQLREETAGMEARGMQMSPEQGQFMQLLIHLLGAKRTLEVGVFTGYSSLCVALALPADGQIVACDVSEEYTSMARRYWQAAGVEHKIQLHLGPAVETLNGMIQDGQQNSFDFAFIDADKENYATYYEQALQLLRPGGLIGIDNVLWGGRAADEGDQDESTQAIRTLNRQIHTDERVELSLVPIGDGLTLARKR